MSRPEGHLLLPGLLEARVQGAIPSRLERLLARADRVAMATPPETRFCHLLGLDDTPVAALTALADGLDGEHGGWLRCDPVSLLANRDRLVLFDPTPSLTDTDAAALLERLNAHLADDGLRLHAPHPQRWYLCVPQAPALAATSPLDAVGSDRLPRFGGDDAALWQRRFTELQMLLHDHPVNAAREAQGRPAINSLWPWGSGSFSRPAALPGWRLLGDHPLVEGARSAFGEDDAGGMLGLVELRSAAPDWAWLEETVVAPAHAALSQGGLQRLRLYPGDGHAWSLTRLGLLRFWR